MGSKSLYIVRHAKAESFSFNKKDFDRHLIDQGITRANEHANILKQDLAGQTDKTLIISSTATRAIETAVIFADYLDYPKHRIKQDHNIYEAHPLQILKSLNDVSANFDKVLLFGHNPGLSDLVAYISDQFISLSTASIACLKIEDELDYSTLSANTATLMKVIGS